MKISRLLATQTNPYPSQEDLELLHLLMKKGYNLTGDADWKEILLKAKSEVKAKRNTFTIDQGPRQLFFEGSVKLRTLTWG